MIKIGDTFKAGDVVWIVYKMPFANWIYLTNNQHFTIEVIWHNQYMAKRSCYDNDGYYLDELEMRMCIEIINKLKGELK